MMGDPESNQSFKRRVDAALQLVHQQRRLLDSTSVGSPAHRRASEILALIEESHFLLSETHRVLTCTPQAAGGLRSETETEAEPETALASMAPSRRRRLLPLIIASAAAFAAAAFVLEFVDPAPMDLQADVLKSMQPDAGCVVLRQCPR